MIKRIIDKLSLRNQMILLVGVTLLGGALIPTLNLLQIKFGGEFQTVAAIYIGVSAVSILAAAYIGTLSGKKAEKLAAAMSAMAKGDLTHELDISGKDEFAWMAYEYGSAVKAVKVIIEGITESSLKLTESASGQAASLEEISASMEEMTTMTKQNAENCDRTADFMKATKKTVEQVLSSLAEVTTSMQEISNVSQDIQNIIKKIDEIAFQTNLLAINAAVEAGNAGKAGAGFAVVAEQVKNLSRQSAEAAKNTKELIEKTVKKIEHGSLLVHNTVETFTEIGGRVVKIDDLVAGIASSSNEQAHGIGQVNKAVAEIDLNTQANARSAEGLRTLLGAFKVADNA